MYKLLIVDDEQRIRNGMANGIPWSDWGFEIAGLAENGIEALKMVESVKPDVVISDIKMPGMDGIGLMKELHKTHPKIKVIILSGYNDFEYMNSAIKNGVVEYLMKPTDLDEYEESFKRIKGILDEERRVSDEFEKSKVYYLDNILNSIIFGYADDEVNSADKGIIEKFNIKTDNCVIAVAGTERDDFTKDEKVRYAKAKELAEICQRCALNIGDDGISIHFFLSRNSSVAAVLSGCDKMLTNEMCMSIFKTVSDMVSEVYKKRLCISFGQICTDIRMIPQCFEQAVCEAYYNMFDGSSAVVQYSEQREPCEIYHNINFDCKLITEAIIKKDIHAVREEMDRVVSFFKENKIDDQRYIEHIFMELMFYLSRWSVERKINFEEIMELEGVKYQDVRRVFGIDKKSEMLMQVIEATIRVVDGIINHRGVNEGITSLIKQCVDTEFAENHMSLEYVADKANKTPSYISKIFKEKFGCGFGEYVTKKRLEASKEMLADPTKKIYEIANNSGYADVSNFIKVFKKVYGISPGNYRKFIQE